MNSYFRSLLFYFFLLIILLGEQGGSLYLSVLDYRAGTYNNNNLLAGECLLD